MMTNEQATNDLRERVAAQLAYYRRVDVMFDVIFAVSAAIVAAILMTV